MTVNRVSWSHLLVLGALCAVVVIADESVVTIASGKVQGRIFPRARAFYNIPYAAPPTGSNRWQPPRSPAPFNGTFDATHWGPACPQICDFPPLTCPFRGQSEDCLRAYVFTPRVADINEPLPVMVFIHGGNFLAGGDATPLYSGLYDTDNTKTIVVTIQYRLGALGFFKNDRLGGNYGFLDQQYALQWVQTNIAAFGGDPMQVTIFGQSAGGTSIAAHLLAPGSFPLYRGAIMESNPIGVWFKTEETTKRISKSFASVVGCKFEDLQCLRALNASEVVQGQNAAKSVYLNDPISAFQPWMPYSKISCTTTLMVFGHGDDGVVIQGQPLVNFTNGQFNHVPFTLGNVQNEALMFIFAAFPDPVGVAEYEAFITLIFRREAPRIIKHFPVPNFMRNDTRHLISWIGTQWIWACPYRNISRYMSREVPVYKYHFDHVFSFDPWGPNYTECIDKVCHGSELPYVFNSAPKGGYKWDPTEKILAEEMATMWGNFGDSLNPNGPYNVSTTWPSFTERNDEDIKFMTPNSIIESGYLKNECDFWDTVGYGWGNGCAGGHCLLDLSEKQLAVIKAQPFYKRWFADEEA